MAELDRNTARMMVRALHMIAQAVHRWTRVVPRELGVPEIECDLTLEVPVDGSVPGIDLMRALEFNLGAVAHLMPADKVCVVHVDDLRILLANAEPRLGRLIDGFTPEKMHARGVETLNGWSRYREAEWEREGR